MNRLLSILSIIISIAIPRYMDGRTVTHETYDSVPDHAIALTGGENGIYRDILLELYDETNRSFRDPDPPRFLLIDKKGNTVFGIGGNIEGVVRYDFDGAVFDNAFNIRDIPVPANPKFRSRFSADATRSSLQFNLLRKTRFGVLSGYIFADFSGENYKFQLSKAYLQLHNFKVGLASSTFQDLMASASTIDYTGPVGQIDKINMICQYKVNYAKGFGWGISAEVPPVGITYGAHAEKIGQRVPDIPAYFQYQWANARSHVRLSAILRNLSYRDMVSEKNMFATGYGVQFSGVVRIVPEFTVIAQTAYGHGIASYVIGAGGSEYDLIPSTTVEGRLSATPTFKFMCGMKYKPFDKFFMTTNYSMMRLYNAGTAGEGALRRGTYALVNAFYSPISELQIGIEYLHGIRKDVSLLSGSANRIQCMIKYSF